MARMTRHLARLTTTLGLALLALAACGDEIEPGDVGRGHKVAISKCTFCHRVGDQGGMIAPPLATGLALANKIVADYDRRIADLQAAHPKAYEAAKASIERVRAERDPAKRYALWLEAYLRDTKFDNPMTRMGNVLMTEQELADIVAWLVSVRPPQ